MKTIKHLLFALVALLCLASCGESTSEMKYLAVQLVGSDMWSIVDIESGEIILKDEFKNQPSVIVNDVFYVENGDGKYDYYNVKDPKKPISQTSYLAATIFSDGYALAVEEGKSISVITLDGKVKAQLPASIKRASIFHQGVAVAVYSDEKFGFIKPDGSPYIDKKYDGYVCGFNDGMAVVAKKSADSIQKYIVIDKSGNELFTKDAAEISGVRNVGDGIVVMEKGDKLVMFDKEGKKVGDLGKPALSNGSAVKDGMAVYYDGESYGLKNTKDEVVVRAKYERLAPSPLGEIFSVPQLYVGTKNDKRGVVDTEGNEVVPFEFEEAAVLTGERFLLGEEKSFSLQDKEKKDVCKENFKNASFSGNGIVDSNFFDAEGIAKNYAAHIAGATFFGVKAGDTFAKYKANAPSPEACEYKTAIDDYEDGYHLALFFDGPLAVSTPRYSTYTNWWGETEQYQTGYDYSYNDAVRIKAGLVTLSVTDYALNSEERFVKALESELKKAGFKQSSPGILKHNSGAAVTIGYEHGIISVTYVFNAKDLKEAAGRKPRKDKNDVGEVTDSSAPSFDEVECDSAVEDYAPVDSVAWDSCAA